MVGRMDLEARLRALRESKQSSAAISTSQLSDATAASNSWPEVPFNSGNNVRQSARVAEEGVHQPVCRTSASFATGPALTIVNSSLPNNFAPSTICQMSAGPSKAVEIVSGQENVLRLTATQLLGPAYEDAVFVAQYAMDNERKQMPHTAIDAYIRAGQMLIEVGRRQAAPHLQDIVKAKALALLQRAEGLSEWTNKVIKNNPSQEALAAAYLQLQESRKRSLSEKQQMVSKMQQDNRDMKMKLNQLIALMKIRGRLMKVVRERRAKKAAQTRATARALHDNLNTRESFNDVTGNASSDEEESNFGGQSFVARLNLGGVEEFHRSCQLKHVDCAPATETSPRREQKMGLINELHEHIGLPQIDRFRKFEPLANDARADHEQEILQSELEAAKDEAENLRSAVRRMEMCLRQAAQHSKQRSIKLELQKEQEVAEVQNELGRVRQELEIERRKSASLQSESHSPRFSVACDANLQACEDTSMIKHLWSSLHKVHRPCDENSGSFYDDRSRRASFHCTSSAHDSSRLKESRMVAQPYDVDEEDMEEDEDGGVWL